MRGKLAPEAHLLMKKPKSSQIRAVPKWSQDTAIDVALYQGVVHEFSIIIGCRII